MSNPVVTFEMENGDVIKAELYPEIAPNTVNNFISLVSKGFYDGLIFHRVIPGFMIQGGDPKGSGIGGPGYCIKGEFTMNRFPNDLKHDRGVLSMARTMAPNSAGSQFFIMHEDSPHLDGQYAAFGKVIEGIEEVDKICAVRTDYNDKPRIPQVMSKSTKSLSTLLKSLTKSASAIPTSTRFWRMSIPPCRPPMKRRRKRKKRKKKAARRSSSIS